MADDRRITNGTAGALAARDSSLVLCASFVVAGPTARLLRARTSGTVTFVVTGEDGQADEDLACAEYIARIAAGEQADAAQFLRRAAAARAAGGLAADAGRGVRGVAGDDVALCLELDRFPFAMVAASEDSLLVLRPHAMPIPAAEVQI